MVEGPLVFPPQVPACTLPVRGSGVQGPRHPERVRREPRGGQAGPSPGKEPGHSEAGHPGRWQPLRLPACPRPDLKEVGTDRIQRRQQKGFLLTPADFNSFLLAPALAPRAGGLRPPGWQADRPRKRERGRWLPALRSAFYKLGLECRACLTDTSASQPASRWSLPSPWVFWD